MALTDFSIATLNVDAQSIEMIETIKLENTLHIYVSLKPTYPECPCCSGKTKIKGYSTYSYNHLPIAGIPSIIDWKRRRYTCKDCGKTFSETSPFGSEHFHQTYVVLDQIAIALHNTQ